MRATQKVSDLRNRYHILKTSLLHIITIDVGFVLCQHTVEWLVLQDEEGHRQLSLHIIIQLITLYFGFIIKSSSL